MITPHNPQVVHSAKKHAVFCGRFSPLHRGHEAVIARMLKDWGYTHSLLVIGSVNVPLSPRNVFSPREREHLIQRVFPGMKMVFAPDYESDDQWFHELNHALKGAGVNPLTSVYFAGSKDDVPFFFRARRAVTIINRYDGTTPVISGTDVRHALSWGQSISHLVNPAIERDIRALFAKNSYENEPK